MEPIQIFTSLAIIGASCVLIVHRHNQAKENTRRKVAFHSTVLAVIFTALVVSLHLAKGQCSETDRIGILVASYAILLSSAYWLYRVIYSNYVYLRFIKTIGINAKFIDSGAKAINKMIRCNLHVSGCDKAVLVLYRNVYYWKVGHHGASFDGNIVLLPKDPREYATIQPYSQIEFMKVKFELEGKEGKERLVRSAYL